VKREYTMEKGWQKEWNKMRIAPRLKTKPFSKMPHLFYSCSLADLLFKISVYPVIEESSMKQCFNPV
jgi:hypothetical protein